MQLQGTKRQCCTESHKVVQRSDETHYVAVHHCVYTGKICGCVLLREHCAAAMCRKCSRTWASTADCAQWLLHHLPQPATQPQRVHLAWVMTQRMMAKRRGSSSQSRIYASCRTAGAAGCNCRKCQTAKGKNCPHQLLLEGIDEAQQQRPCASALHSMRVRQLHDLHV